jgi:hypothetical protein
MNRLLPILLLVFWAGCSASFESLQPGFGTALNVYESNYDTLWDVVVGVTSENLSILNIDKAGGVIKAEHKPSFVECLSNPRRGELILVRVSPQQPSSECYAVEVTSMRIDPYWPFGRDWEPKLVADIKSRCAPLSSERTQRNLWRMITTKGDTLTGVFLEKFVSDSLTYSYSGRRSVIRIEDVSEIRQMMRSRFWVGAGMGAILGGIVGSIVGPSLSDATYSGSYGVFYGAIHGGLCGALVGVGLEEIATTDVVYHFQNMKLSVRIETLNAILSRKN